MTRKDYEMLAASVQTIRTFVDSVPDDTVRHAEQVTLDLVAIQIADGLAADNARFDRQRFLAAAGVK